MAEKLSPIQLEQLSDEALDDLYDSLLKEHDRLEKSLPPPYHIEGMPHPALGEVRQLDQYILAVRTEMKRRMLPSPQPEEKKIIEPASVRKRTKGRARLDPGEVFDNFRDAADYAKQNPGYRISRTNTGDSFRVSPPA